MLLLSSPIDYNSSNIQMVVRKVFPAVAVVLATVGQLTLLGRDYTWSHVSKGTIYVYPVKPAQSEVNYDGQVELEQGREAIRIGLLPVKRPRNLIVRVFKGTKADLSSEAKNYPVNDCFLYCYTDYRASVGGNLDVPVKISTKWLSVATNVKKWVNQAWVLVPVIDEKSAHDDLKTPDGQMLIQKNSLATFFDAGIEVVVRPKSNGPESGPFSTNPITFLPILFAKPEAPPYTQARPQKDLTVCYEVKVQAEISDILVARVGGCLLNRD
jgi:hypothetical protein